MKQVHRQSGRNFGKSEALRVADKLLGLPVEQLLKRLADAVRRGESERIVEVIRVADGVDSGAR